MDIEIIKMSSKGQIVIPKEMREGLEVGEKMVIIKENDQMILKRVKDFKENIEAEVRHSKRINKIIKRRETHPEEFISMNRDDFLKELEKW